MHPLALLHCEPLCTKTPRWNSLDEVSGRGTIAIRVRSSVEADAVMKVNVERAPSRAWEEWAGPPKQWTQSSEGGGGEGESGWGQLFLINCFHVIDWLLICWLTGRGASSRHWLNVFETSWRSSWSVHQRRDTYQWAWERAASHFLFLSFTLAFFLFRHSVSTSSFSPSFISVLFMFSIVSIEGGLCWNSSSLPFSVLHPPFLQHTGCMNKNI